MVPEQTQILSHPKAKGLDKSRRPIHQAGLCLLGLRLPVEVISKEPVGRPWAQHTSMGARADEARRHGPLQRHLGGQKEENSLPHRAFSASLPGPLIVFLRQSG